ncbi:hypothetical protein K470DRAFT_126524 [Piedraia hortae CBS 480.64]|uniref:Uncharacterized protein n=1 Tax=Piedraia hortae CBS 480.64 TaxID=1314780 RepID=A0A6A7C7I8_9PEZI|nr:hypothetical protein K470DRAFT_126524 [Piedraia hortae CBS 480.64]
MPRGEIPHGHRSTIPCQNPRTGCNLPCATGRQSYHQGDTNSEKMEVIHTYRSIVTSFIYILPGILYKNRVRTFQARSACGASSTRLRRAEMEQYVLREDSCGERGVCVFY